jgi:four helix bundle protein
MIIRSHRDLQVWQRSMDLVDAIYSLTRSFPRDERYGLITQMRRAAFSVPCNIAEGRGRGSRRDFANFISIAKGSLLELETLLEVSVRQGFATREAAEPLSQEMGELERMLTRMRSRLTDVSHGAHPRDP